MCVLILHHRLIPGYPVVVAANRDEARDRPSDPPFLWPQGILAPRDRRAHGTWIGLNRHGLVAGITNRSRGPIDPARSSRGELVVEALTAPTARAGVARVERAAFSAPRNPFNLLIADAREAFLVVGGDAVTVRPLPPGTHVLSNEHDLGELDLGDLTPSSDIDLELARLCAVCQDHGARAGYALCKHGARHGTVSSTLIAAGDAPEHPDRFAFADGMPCLREHAELEEPVRSLRAARSR